MSATAVYQKKATYVAVNVGPRDWFWRAYLLGVEVAQGHATSRPKALERARVAVINKGFTLTD